MDHFCEWVKENFFFDPTHKEIQDISEAVQTLTKKIVCQFNKSTDDCYIQQLVGCGSMVEGTRIWGKHTRNVRYSENPGLLRIIEAAPEIEYDYLAVIDNTQSGNLICEELCEEHVQFRDSKYNDTEKCIEQFKINVMAAIASLCNCFTFEVYKESDDIFFSNVNATAGCEICMVEMDTGKLKVHAGFSMGYRVLQSWHLEFEWISKGKELCRPIIEPDFKVSVENVSKLIILLDLNPAIKIANVGKCEQTRLTEQLYAFPKKCNNNHKSCWRISRCVSEVHAFRNANTEHKMCFIALKFICIFCKFGSILNTYHIKSAILHHIKTCSEANTSQCLQKVLCFLSEKMKIVTLLKFDTGYNLFSNVLTKYKNEVKLHGDLFEIISQPRIWKDDSMFNMKLMTSLSFVFSSSSESTLVAYYTNYYKCKNIDRVLDQVKGAIEKHGINCDWNEIKLECEIIFKENFVLE